MVSFEFSTDQFELHDEPSEGFAKNSGPFFDGYVPELPQLTGTRSSVQQGLGLFDKVARWVNFAWLLACWRPDVSWQNCRAGPFCLCLDAS